MSTSVNLSRWDPFRDLNRVQEQLNRFFGDDLFRRSGESALTAWAPAVDIHENKDELVLEADLPGFNEKDLDIRVEDNTLTVRGERKFEKKVEEENYLRMERAYGSFARSFAMPHTVNTESIKAVYRDGVLTIRLPKREEAKPKQVKVNVESH